MNGIQTASETALENGSCQGDAVAPSASMRIGKETIDIVRHMLVEPLLSAGQRERNSIGVTLGEERVAFTVPQFLFDTSQKPLIAPTCARVPQHLAVQLQTVIARIGKSVGIQQTQKLCKLAGV